MNITQNNYESIFCGAANDGPESTEEKRIRGLWRAVIMQMLVDASNNSKKKQYKLYKTRALEWLKGDNADFFTVCALADMDPEYVKYQAKCAISRGCKWRNDSKTCNYDLSDLYN